MDQNNQPILKPVAKEPKSIFDIIFKVLGLFIFLAIVTAISFLTYLYITARQNKVFYEETVGITTPVAKPTPKIKALVAVIPNFEKLALSDLFAQNDIRGVYPYKDKQIIIGYGKVLEYDPIKKEVSRISNENLNCTFSGTVAGDKLFIGCQSEEFAGPSKFFEIDLASGEILNVQTGINGLNLVNSRLIYDGKFLWIGSWDGALKIDLETKTTKLYPPNEIDPQCDKSNLQIFFADSKLIALCASNKDSVTVLDNATDKWVSDDSVKYDVAILINRRLREYGIDIPRFFAYSKVINGKRYLLADKGVYTLTKGTFPVQLVDLDLVEYSNLNSVQTWESLDALTSNQLYISKNENYGVLFNIPMDVMSPAEGTVVLFVDLANKTVENILTDASLLQKQKLVDMFPDFASRNALYWTDSDTSIEAFYNSKKLMSIDLVSKSLKLFLDIVPNL